MVTGLQWQNAWAVTRVMSRPQNSAIAGILCAGLLISCTSRVRLWWSIVCHTAAVVMYFDRSKYLVLWNQPLPLFLRWQKGGGAGSVRLHCRIMPCRHDMVGVERKTRMSCATVRPVLCKIWCISRDASSQLWGRSVDVSEAGLHYHKHKG